MEDRKKERIESEYVVWMYDMKRKYDISTTEISKIIFDYEEAGRAEINKWRIDNGTDD